MKILKAIFALLLSGVAVGAAFGALALSAALSAFIAPALAITFLAYLFYEHWTESDDTNDKKP